ncbi:MAG: bifunctional acetate--CoA ligase family protein/GNAT family N-acetyltransferase [Desulfovibrio sp.]
MSDTNLKFLFRPQSIAVIGASKKADSAGTIVMRNIMSSGFDGPVMPVSTGAEAIAGVLTYKEIEDLPKVPDLAVVCEPLKDVPNVLKRLSKIGTRGAVLMGEGFSGMSLEEQQQLRNDIMAATTANKMRILGPKSVGFAVPSLNLNASLSHTDIGPGKTAFITQSDSLFTMVQEWANSRGIGFSHLISLGSRIDVSFSDILDYLGSDPYTRSILLYVESINKARAFMSAARAASRNKPVLVLHPGQALQHELIDPTRMDAGVCLRPDEVYDLVFRRAGMLRVNTIDGLFDAAKTLAIPKPFRGNRLGIITNGASGGIVAADALLSGEGQLGSISEVTCEALKEIFKTQKVFSNPVAIPFNATGDQYAKALKVLLKDKGIDAVMVMNVPFAASDGTGIAQAVADSLRRVRRMVLTCWLGTESAENAREIFKEAGIPSYARPDKAIRAFLHMAEFKKNQDILIETPDSLPTDFYPDTRRACDVIDKALAEDRIKLTDPEAREVLAAYGIPVIETRIAVSAKDAVIAADGLGYPVALKLRSPEIIQPFDVGAVALDLDTPEQVWESACSMLARVHLQRPDAHIEGFTVQKMGRRPGAHELFISADVDPVFGPMIRFGHGGMSRDMVKDSAMTMPPLSMTLAKEVIGRTRISKLLPGTPSHPPVDMDDLCLTLIQISQLIIDIPEVVSLGINPLYASDQGVLALSAEIGIQKSTGHAQSRLAIKPYPRELEECITLKNDRRVTLRPIRPEDEPTHAQFISQLSDEDLRLRFFGVVQREFDHKEMARFTQIDYDREMAFIASSFSEEGKAETLGVVRTSTSTNNSEAEFSIVVRSDLKGTGLGSMLFEKMLRYTKARGTGRIFAPTMVENKAMQGLGEKYGFTIKPDPDDAGLVYMSLVLNPAES